VTDVTVAWSDRLYLAYLFQTYSCTMLNHWMYAIWQRLLCDPIASNFFTRQGLGSPTGRKICWLSLVGTEVKICFEMDAVAMPLSVK